MHTTTERHYYNNNDFVELFESRLSEYTGAPHVVAVNCCTNAIFLSLIAKGIDKEQSLVIPNQTYMSVPMTLINFGYNVKLKDYSWVGNYEVGNTSVFDYAVAFEKDMFIPGQIQCLSFQQKKRLPIGKGGAILLDDKDLCHKLKRLRHDGRNSSMPERNENPNDIIMGYHMYMSPDEAAKGTLLLNQLTDQYTIGSSNDYIACSNFPVLRNYK